MPPPRTTAVTDPAGPLGPWIARVLEIGGGVVPALRALGDEIPEARRAGWQELCRTLAEGDAARAARGIDADPDIWIPLLAAAAPGATTGDGMAEGAFLRCAVDTMVRREDQSRWWLPALYPLAVLLFALVVTTFLATFVVPTFEAMFADFGMRLPMLTASVLALARVLRAVWWLLLPALAIVTLLAMLPGRRPRSVRPQGNRFVRSGRFARNVADLLAAGVPETEAVAMAARAADPQGERVDGALPGWLTETVRHALETEMPAATRIRLLERIADCHEQRLSARNAWASWCVGPLAVFVTGLAVFLLVLALFMPLIKLVSALSS